MVLKKKRKKKKFVVSPQEKARRRGVRVAQEIAINTYDPNDMEENAHYMRCLQKWAISDYEKEKANRKCVEDSDYQKYELQDIYFEAVLGEYKRLEDAYTKRMESKTI